MLAMVAGLGALFALGLAIGPVRDFFELVLLSAGQWFLALLCVAIGLAAAAIGWRLPRIQELEEPAPEAEAGVPRPTHQPKTGEYPVTGRV
jgi:hypothetical protein